MKSCRFAISVTDRSANFLHLENVVQYSSCPTHEREETGPGSTPLGGFGLQWISPLVNFAGTLRRFAQNSSTHRLHRMVGTWIAGLSGRARRRGYLDLSDRLRPAGELPGAVSRRSST